MVRILPALLVSVLFCGAAFAQQQDPTPRRDISPLDRAKVSHAQAKRWIGFSTQQDADDTLTRNRVGPGSNTCVTNIGTTTQNPATVGGFTPRYGPAPRDQRGDRVVVVNGSVINVCK